MFNLRPQSMALLSLLMLFAAAASLSAAVSIDGTVRSETGQPIAGATVIALSSGVVVAGAASDEHGHFELRFAQRIDGALDLRVSSVGYYPGKLHLTTDESEHGIMISLREDAVEIPGMRVTPQPALETHQILRHDAVQAGAAQSLVMTNPIAALREPQVSRVGSNLSSQIRVYGTNPVYYLNGLPIGTDPAHYGMFSYVPSSIVDRMEFLPLGTTADQHLPAVVEFNTPELFGQPSGADVILSTIEATGTVSLATDRMYVQGSLRKSVLDRLVDRLKISSDRATLAPTNFQDAFGTLGLKLSRTSRLMIDYYQVRDFLSYNASDLAKVQSIDTYQSSHEKQVGVRLEDRRAGFITHLTFSTRRGDRTYKALPSNRNSTSAVRVNLNEDYRTDFGQAGLDLYLGHLLLKTGVETEQDRHRDYSLEQRNWNFLPPFASTDNPFIYQGALNATYGDRSGDAGQGRTSGFLSGELPIDNFTLALGVRHDKYAPLKRGDCTVYRSRLGWTLGRRTGLSLSWGIYSNSPLDNILEPYQVIVRTDLSELTPVTTNLGSAQFTWGGLGIGVFRKTLGNLPVISPDFSVSPTTSGDANQEFIGVQSSGSARFEGMFITADDYRLWGDRVGLTASYAYTVSRTYEHGIISRYDLDVPHRFQTQIDYRCTRKLNLGVEVQVRSGYPFSPLRSRRVANESKLYQWEYYRATLANENSLRFATNAYLNLSARYQIGRAELLMSIANLTNRANPLVYSSAGLIYDAGILPMIGLRVNL